MVDVKPTNMNDLNEVITSSEFHPFESHLFAWGSSRGALNLVDMRCGSLLDRTAKSRLVIH
jgi:serine/threonine-protein phosphatase 2A regulatory subunit B